MHTHHLRRRSSPVVLVLAFVLGACGSDIQSVPPTGTPVPIATAGPTAPPPTPTPIPKSAAEQYADIRAAVEQIRGLKPTSAVDPVTIDEAQLVANLGSEFDADNKPADLGNAEDELIALGLLPQGTSLRAQILALEGGQVAGYYAPDKNQLFVVSRSGALGGTELSTYSHEFTHELQHQNFDFNLLGLSAHDQGDGALAGLALVEGDAVSVQSTWMSAHLTPQQLGEVMSAALDPVAVKALSDAPRYLRETALFPYNEGLLFVEDLIGMGGYDRVDAAFRDPPMSTEQILHPDKYLQRDPPIAVTIPATLAASLGTGWSIAAEDTLGEEVLRIFLEQVLTTSDAIAGAAGWGGDRLVLLRGPNDAVMVGVRTTWDTPADADEFLAAATQAAAGMQLHATFEHTAGSPSVTMALGADSAVLAPALAK